jgi:glycosyltransferase involved in cell wall biosynthesis
MFRRTQLVSNTKDQSVLAQTIRPHQLIMVDDGPTDGSRELIERYKQRYSKLMKPVDHACNAGIVDPRIDALRAVTGDYVTYVDGDDRFVPLKIQTELKLQISNPDARIACCNNYYMSGSTQRTGLWDEEDSVPQDNVFLQTYGRDFPKRHLSRMELVDYQTWRAVGVPDTRLSLYEDFEMRKCLTKHCFMVYCPEPLSEMRVHGTGLSSVTAMKYLQALDYIQFKSQPILADLSPFEREQANCGYQSWIREVILPNADKEVGPAVA